MSRQSFVNMALSYLGVKEGSAKHKYIIDTYNSIVPLPVNYKVKYTDAWCATFVSFCAAKCGMLNIIPAECSCPRQIELWKKMGRWVNKNTYVPKTGDIVYYDFNGDGVSDHVGIVVSVSNGIMKVVEGNYSDSVKCRTIAVNANTIIGFGCPKFKEEVLNSSSKESVFTMELKVLKQGSRGEQVRALQILLVGRGQKLPKYGCDGDYGDETVSAVKAFQKAKGISVDGIAGKNTFSKLLLG